MPDTIVVIVEQREGKLNRVSWETITAGQAIAAATGWSLEAAVVGGSAASIAAEVAAKKVARVYAVESPKLEPYTPDAFAAIWRLDRSFRPTMPENIRDQRYRGWRDAMARTLLPPAN